MPQPINFAAYQLTDGSTDINTYVASVIAANNLGNSKAPTDYRNAAAPYNLTSALTPPPSPTVTLEMTWTASAKVDDGASGSDRDLPPNKTVDSIQIPAGYQATTATITVDVAPSLDGVTQNSWWVSVVLGNKVAMWTQQGSGTNSVLLGGMWLIPYPVPNAGHQVTSVVVNLASEIAPPSGSGGTVPLTISALNVRSYNVAIEISCQRTPTAISTWQNQVYATLVAQYNSLLSDYQTAQAATQATSAGTQYQGSNPDENQTVINTELKKSIPGDVYEPTTRARLRNLWRHHGWDTSK
jgi:hypothetical protein